jgi:IS4 transposase
LNKGLAPLKTKGYSFEWIMGILISLPFMGISTVNKLSGLIEAQKDVFYRIKNNPSISWRYILWLFACKFNKITSTEADNHGNPKCLIFDDTVIEKTGKFIEKVSRVWDHVQNRSVLGFKLLVMGYWDGTSFIPLDFSLHREVGKNETYPCGLRKKDYRKQFKKSRFTQSHGYDRCKEADQSKIDSMIRLFKRAVSYGFKIDYVLVDSWFTCEAIIDAIARVKNQTIHFIGMYKIAKTLFEYNGDKLTYSQIRNRLGRPKRCRKLKLYYLQAFVEFKGHKLQLFFTRQGKNGTWKVLLTTDCSLSFIRTAEIYQTRWTIEVFFKESKQLLGLGSCQSNDFDAHITDITITLIQHMLVTFRYRYDTYETKGALFEQVMQTSAALRLNERLWGLFIELMQILADLFNIEDAMDILGTIIQNDQAVNKLKNLFDLGVEQDKAA